ncbi:hamartin [Parelaphostrongylus tenuis]|uniref:Hamartin n=1 Tax=Parelaphostrongylus tenuis TaxID=148309 RepID=A0AAD5QLS1_PARTN|nr:hamartin [Parelaphostrongylus tenuis]
MTDISRQISLLESQDSRVSDDARQALSLQINLGNGIYQLVHHYVQTHSDRALDLLCKIQEPHDKTFLDSLSDTIKEQKIMATLYLLGEIVQTAPSWTPKIALHPVFKAILQHSVNTKQLGECIGVLLFATALLPHCCSFPLDVLNALFHTFVDGCQTYRTKWLLLDSRKSDENWDRADVAHIAFAIREFFHALYGIYPTNFISYLRNHFVDKAGGSKRRDVATYVLCPLLAGVRLHPNLILVGKDKELSKDRWHQRESHDFLDDCRRNVIGKIPLQIINDGFDICSDPESPPAAPQDTFPLLFSSNTSLDSGNYGWPIGDSQNDLLNALNTPPGSRSELSPQRRNTVDEDWAPIFITSDERRRRSVDGGGIRSFRNSIGSFFKRDRGRNEIDPPCSSPSEVVVYAADISENQNQNDEAEEAEEAADFLMSLEEQDPYRGRLITPDASVTRSPFEQNPPQACPFESANEGLRIAQAAQAAVLAVRRERHAAVLDPDDSVVRSRSASFLFDTPHVDVRDKGNAQERERQNDSDYIASSENPEGYRNRFSIGSFFSKLNRQRFASECHPDIPSTSNHNARHSTEAAHFLVRVASCPDVMDESRAPVGLVRDEITTKVPHANLLERFPYLRLIQSPGKQYYAEIEANLESEHEIRRATYIEKSRDFHQCLRELGLADRLPGRIYDDMTHITEGLPMEKQRDILRARLILVNQHLLYERSCRLLHANRNRRLFGRIKLQKVTEAELEQLKENLHIISGERKELISALSGLRRSLDTEKRNRVAMESEMLDKMRELELETYRLKERLYEANSQKRFADLELKRWKSQIDHYRRRTDDAEEHARMLRLQLASRETKIQELKKTQASNQQLRDQMRVLESRCEEERHLRLKHGNVRRDRLRQDLERVQAELVVERSAVEEHRSRASEWEHICKAESVRSTELKGMLERATNLLCEQNEAAEQKFLSLQAVVRKQEEHIFDLYRRVEERDDVLRRMQCGPSTSSECGPSTSHECGPSTSSDYFPPACVPSEVQSFNSSLSDTCIPHDVLYGRSPTEYRSSEERLRL